MSTKKQPPRVMLVGRTNVGKSTLFNRLTSKTKTIVHDREHVTRDYIHEFVTWDDKTFDLIDTGGMAIVPDATGDDISRAVHERVMSLLNTAALFLFVCDVKNGLTEEDRRIARMLHRTKKPIILLLNKADHRRGLEENRADFYALGIDEMFGISATHGLGIATLLQRITEEIAEAPEVEEDYPTYSVAIIGKPNVGKSSLMNLLLKEERAIVSPVAGTTREAISENIHFYKDTVQLTDTAGIRRKRKVSDELETLMVKSSFRSVRAANIIIMLIDATAGKLADQELKLLFYAAEEKKAIIIVFNKVDLMTEDQKETLGYD